tara:strand:- start:5907 stop:6545 length:639 start_codon:yes stop_codon:yes gene_type:complete
MAEIDNNINEIHISRNNLLKQLKAAGYNINPYENTTLNEVYYMNMHDDLDFKVNSINDSTNTIHIKYNIGKPLKANTIQSITSEMFKYDEFDPTKNIIVILIDSEPNSTICDVVKQIYAEESIYIVLYNIKRLLFNIQEHTMVPKHSILSKENENVFFSKYSITEPASELPTISRFDPVALSIFIKPKQICEIDRASINSIQGKYYRFCVNY